MKTTPEQREKMAQAFYRDSQDKRLPPTKRLEARIQAKRWRALAQWGKEREASQKQAK